MRRNRVAIAFIIVVVVATAVATFGNRSSINDLEKARRESCTNFLVLRKAVNDFHGTLTGFLEKAREARVQAARTENNKLARKTDLQAAAAYENLLENTHTVKATCAQKR